MALTYRSPILDAISSFDPSIQNVIATAAAEHYKKLEEDLFEFFRYDVDAYASMRLIKAGIYLSPYAGVPHAHPVCKMIENHMLYVVLPTYITNDFYFVGIKNSKLSTFRLRNPKMKLVKGINRYVTSLDKSRYTSDFVIRHSSEHIGLKRHSLCLSKDTLRDLVPRIMVESCKNIFLHDELHYWSIEELTTFLEVVKPVKVLGTIVFPPELLKGSNESLNKWCYTYELQGSSICFYPDGHRAGSYQQPVYGGFLLECNRVELADGTIYCVDILESKYAHHLVAITLGDACTPTRRSFGPFEATACNGIEPITRDVRSCFPIRHEVVLKVYTYLRTLKKPDGHSAMAKLSQLVDKPTGAEIKFMEEFSGLVIDSGNVRTTICPSRLKIFMGKYLGLLPGFVADKFKSVRELSLDDFVRHMEPYTVDVRLRKVEWNSGWSVQIFEKPSCEDDFDLIQGLDDQYTMGRVIGVPENRRAPYHFTSEKCRSCRGPLFVIPDAVLREVVGRLCYESFVNSDGSLPDEKTMNIYFRWLTTKAFLRASNLQLLTLFGADRPGGLLRYIRSRWSDRIKFYFWSYGLNWFRSARRFNQKYLEHASATRAIYRDIELQYSSVLKDLAVFGDRLNKTGNSRWRETIMVSKGLAVDLGGPNYATMRSTVESEIQHPEPPSEQLCVEEPVNQEWMPEMETGDGRSQCNSQLRCSCGVEMPISFSQHLGLHDFKFPDRVGRRKCGWYNRGTPVDYKYSGITHKSIGWPAWLEQWMELNDVDSKYNCCLAQEYEHGAKIGFHADDEPIFSDGEEIATVNVVGEARFDIKCAKGSGSTMLNTGACFTMPFNFQKTHMHSVCAMSEKRVSVTFRVLRERKVERGPEASGNETADQSYTNEGNTGVEAEHVHEAAVDISSKDEGAEPEVAGTASDAELSSTQGSSDSGESSDDSDDPFSRKFIGGRIHVEQWDDKRSYRTTDHGGGGDCFWLCLGEALGLSPFAAKKLACAWNFGDDTTRKILEECAKPHVYTVDEAILAAACTFSTTIHVVQPKEGLQSVFAPDHTKRALYLELDSEHFRLMHHINGCVVRAISDALKRDESEVINVIERNCDEHLIEAIWSGQGLDRACMQLLFELFDIKGHVDEGCESVVLNAEGSLPKCFVLDGEHLSYIKDRKTPSHAIFSKCETSVEVKPETLRNLLEAGTTLCYKAELKRAKKLADSLHKGSTGVISSELFNECANLSESFKVKQTECRRDVLGIFGTFGSGKSTLFRKFMQCNLGRSIEYVSPRKQLLKDFREGVVTPRSKALRAGRKKDLKKGQENWHFTTFEVFLRRAARLPEGTAVIIDEIQLYPPGYLDVVTYMLSDKVHLVVAGDPCQSDYDNEKDRAWLSGIEADNIRLLKDVEYKFNITSRRFLNRNLCGRLPCSMEGRNLECDEKYEIREGLEILQKLDAKWSECYLVPSFEDKALVEFHLADKNAKILTYGESTGLNFNYGCVIISMNSESTNEKRWITALSRFRLSVCFVNITGLHMDSVLNIYRNRSLGKFIKGTACERDIKSMLPGRPNFVNSFSTLVGKDEGVREEKLQGDPWLKTMIDLLQVEDQEEAEADMEVVATDEYFKTHLPQAELESVRAQWVHKFMAKEHREVRMGDKVSEQFTDEHSKQAGKVCTNAAERFEAIYPRHRASDTVTFIMAVKKRLRFSKPHIEIPKLRKAMNYGPMLLQKFLKFVPIKPAHDTTLMAKAKRDFEDKKVSKSAAIIENHSGRSSKDWLIEIAQIFSKSQMCTKFEKRFVTAKAAQSIVCFQHSVLCRFAPYMRYIEMKLAEALPDNFYIHSGKGLDELDKWVKKYEFNGVCTESDYEAFDASQDQHIMAFEISLMRYLGLPKSLIADYEYIKTHLGSKLGNFSIMRFSGEASTFLFNTMANMLFTFMRYKVKGNEAICFAGDDMCAAKKLQLSSKHEDFLKRLKLKAKVQFTPTPTFCGWNLCPDGIYKKPQLVLERMYIAIETGNLHNCLDNYAIEVSYAYRMGEKAVCRMNEEERAAYYNCVRLIVKKRRLLKSDVADVYKNCDL